MEGRHDEREMGNTTRPSRKTNDIPSDDAQPVKNKQRRADPDYQAEAAFFMTLIRNTLPLARAPLSFIYVAEDQWGSRCRTYQNKTWSVEKD